MWYLQSTVRQGEIPANATHANQLLEQWDTSAQAEHRARAATLLPAPPLPPQARRWHTAAHAPSLRVSHSPGTTHGKKAIKQSAHRPSVHAWISWKENRSERGWRTRLWSPAGGTGDRSIYQSLGFGLENGSLSWAAELCRAKKNQSKIGFAKHVFAKQNKAKKLVARYLAHVRRWSESVNTKGGSGKGLPAELNLCSQRWFILPLKTGYFS